MPKRYRRTLLSTYFVRRILHLARIFYQVFNVQIALWGTLILVNEVPVECMATTNRHATCRLDTESDSQAAISVFFAWWLSVEWLLLHLSPPRNKRIGEVKSSKFVLFSFFHFGAKRSIGQSRSTGGSWSFGKFCCHVKRRCHSRELNRRPLPWDLGVSPPSSSSLGSSKLVMKGKGLGQPLLCWWRLSMVAAAGRSSVHGEIWHDQPRSFLFPSPTDYKLTSFGSALFIWSIFF
jgi:hypothetical protein